MTKSRRGLLNYTTQVDVNTSISEVITILARAGAQSILQRYDGFGNVSSLEFSVTTSFGQMGFRLPLHVNPVLKVLQQQVNLKKIPRRYASDKAQARRVAWRILKDWVEAQMAIVQIGMARMEQIMMSYTLDPATGQTLFEIMSEQRFQRFALPETTTSASGQLPDACANKT